MTHYDPREHEIENEDVKKSHKDRLKVVIVVIIFWVLLLWALTEAIAGERIRIYDTKGGFQKYTGYAEKQSNGSYRFYDKHGLYQGRMENDRFLSKDGDVINKLYRMPLEAD